jgi:hypothetical protein
MPKKIAAFVFALAALLLLAALASATLEIRPRQVFVPPSREALVNNFFALEKWLARTGHPVRFLRRGGPAQITGAPEKAVFVQASAFDWEDAEEPLKNWAAAGGFLLVSLDLSGDDYLETFLANLGIGFETPAADTAGAEDTAVLSADNTADNTDDNTDDLGGETGGGEAVEPADEPPPEGVPDFDQTVRFTVSEETAASAFTLKERGDIIRLVRIPLGAGAAAFIGGPRFMGNDYLEREANARLAWDVTGARTGGDNPGLLFIRGRRQAKSLFGKLAERGNFLPLGVSALVLIIIGFWMAIPPFGLLFQEKKLSSRPVRERFLAEIRFLKKYRALETYPEAYILEIRRKLRGREEEPELEAIERALKTKGPLPYKDLIQSLQKLKTMMERL